MKTFKEYSNENVNSNIEINPCNFDTEKLKKWNKLKQKLEENNVNIWRIRTPCPNFREYISKDDYNKLNGDIKKELKKITNL